MKILFILAFFSVVVYLVTRKFHSKVLTGGVIFFLFAFLGHFVPLSESNELLLERIILNLAPATLFLFFLDLDLKRLLKNGVGCSCQMGAKRYWLIVLLAAGASFLAQLGAYALFGKYVLYIAAAGGALLGLAASFTPLGRLCGTEEVATTMLYLLLAVLGLKIL